MINMGKFVNSIFELLKFIMFISITVMIVLVFINVVFRYGFNDSLKTSAELSKFLFVWVIMLGAIVASKDGSHLTVSVLDKVLPQKFSLAIKYFSYFVIFCCSIMILIGCYRLAVLDWYNLATFSKLPIAVKPMAGIVAGFFMAAIALYSLFQLKKSKKVEQ